ncbi:MAG: hypothetical protein FWB83_08535 [Treponema sp.]|nr:hypothetical protein [Treponema sp.]
MGSGNFTIDFFRRFKTHLRLIIFTLAAFASGFLLAGFFIGQQGSPSIGELDNRYAEQYGRASEIVGRLEAELDRERDINNKLREHNSRARELTGELAFTTERNVRNLQDAVAIIGEIRRKLQILEDFYADSGSGGGAD